MQTNLVLNPGGKSGWRFDNEIQMRLYSSVRLEEKGQTSMLAPSKLHDHFGRGVRKNVKSQKRWSFVSQLSDR